MFEECNMSNFSLPRFTEQEIIEKRNKRLFSVPYNNSDPDQYFEIIHPYLKNIDNVYLEYPRLIKTHLTKSNLNFEQIIEQRNNTDKFLSKYGNKVKCVLALNSCFYPMTPKDDLLFVSTELKPLIEKYSCIKSVIVADFIMAESIRHFLPDIGIQTSCNTYQYITRPMVLWNKILKIEMFNPPRESARNIDLLKLNRMTGFKMKYLVNENCVYGCPQQINHCCYIASNTPSMYYCDYNTTFSDFLRSNFILPRWLKYLDDYVDVFKIAGRTKSLEFIKKALDAYINERNNINLLDILQTRQDKAFKKIKSEFEINTKYIPDKLLNCQCKQCDTCNVCKNVMKMIFNKNGITDPELISKI